MYIYPLFFRFFPHIGQYRVLSRILRVLLYRAKLL